MMPSLRLTSPSKSLYFCKRNVKMNNLYKFQLGTYYIERIIQNRTGGILTYIFDVIHFGELTPELPQVDAKL